MLTLGLDASTTTCGYAFVENRIPLDIGWIDLSKLETNKEKVKAITNFVKNHDLYQNVSKINLESAVSGFAGGKTSQQILIKLSRFNGILEYVLNEDLSPHVTNLIGATTARKKAFGKARITGIKPKIFVKNELDLRFDLKKFEKINKVGNVDKRMEDAYDALVLGMN